MQLRSITLISLATFSVAVLISTPAVAGTFVASSFNGHSTLVAGKQIRDTIRIDAGDPTPNWDSVWLGLCCIDSCITAQIDNDGVYTVYSDTGAFFLNAFGNGYLTSPDNRPIYVTEDTTSGLSFTLNATTCRVHGTLTGLDLPILYPLIVFAAVDDSGSYQEARPVSAMTGTFELELCDGTWTITPPAVSGFDTLPPVHLTIGELPDSVRTVDLNYVVTDVDDVSNGLPAAFALSQNFPNPFNPTTEIEFTLPRKSPVKLAIYNVLGQTITSLLDEIKPAGRYRIVWDGRNAQGQAVASGVYFYQLEAGEFIQNRRMLLLK